MKRFGPVLLILCALLILAAPLAAAEETVSARRSADRSVALSGSDGADARDELFYQFMLNAARSGTTRSAANRKGAQLTGNDRAVYDALAGLIVDVAAGARESTQLVMLPSDFGLTQASWSAEELGVSAIVEDDAISDAAIDALWDLLSFDMDAVFSALLADYPYELFWFNKTSGVGCGGDMPCEVFWQDGAFRIAFGEGTQTVFLMDVASEYATGDVVIYDDRAFHTTLDVGKLALYRVADAVAEANAIVSRHAGESDYQKLYAYKDEICAATSYNVAAADESTGTPYGNPWQLIYVFDGDPNTEVVCEGYAKAFQFLCDLSDFAGDVRCSAVTGMMGDEPHMWNLVRMPDAKVYMADITNCDEGAVGASDLLFLAGHDSGSVTDGYVFSCDQVDVLYVYDKDILAHYSEGDLTVSGSRYEEGAVVAVWPATIQGVTYELIDGDVTATGCDGSAASLAFVDTVYDLPVGRIGAYAFAGCDWLTGPLVIPAHVRVIEMGAFENCTGLDGALQLPEGLIEIQAEAFRNCSGLTGRLMIPDTVQRIGTTDPDRRYGAYDIVQPFGAFEGCEGFTGSLALPDSLTVIGDFTFAGCSGLSGELVIGENVEVIGSEAFSNCSGFTGALRIPSSVTQIKSFAFEACSGFDQLILGDHVAYIEARAFGWCSGFAGSLDLPQSVAYIGQNAFMQCAGFSGDLLLPDSITHIGIGAFSLCSGMNGTLRLPRSLEALGAGAFAYCGFTGEVGIPERLALLGGLHGDIESWEGPFYRCAGITGFRVEEGNASYCDVDGVLFDKAGETLLVFPCAKGGDYAVPDGTTGIAPHAFAGCSSLTGVTIPDSVALIGFRAFEECDSLTAATIGGGIDNIPEGAFCFCYQLSSVTIPDSVTAIGDSAFGSCSLEDVYYGGNLSQWNAVAFNADMGNECLLTARIHCGGACEHVWGDPTYEWAADCGAVVATRVCALDESHVETETAATVVALETAPTEFGAGSTRYTAFFENEAFETQSRIVEDIPALSDMDVVYLPLELGEIGEEAFAGLTCQAVVVPEGCVSIGRRAFADCPNLIYIRIPAGMGSVAEDAFEGCGLVRIDCAD